MTLDTEADFTKAYQRTQGFAPHAARRLRFNETDYPEDTVHVFGDGRPYVTLETTAMPVFNPNPDKPVKKLEMKGWNLNAERFFLSRRGKLMVVWYDRYATFVTVRTYSTIRMFFDASQIACAATELKEMAGM